jgi:hypothetical protein
MDNMNNIDDFENPLCECEICETMVRFNDYNRHIENCLYYHNYMQRHTMLQSPFMNIVSHGLVNAENNQEDENHEFSQNEQEGEVEDDTVPLLQQSSIQIPIPLQNTDNIPNLNIFNNIVNQLNSTVSTVNNQLRTQLSNNNSQTSQLEQATQTTQLIQNSITSVLQQLMNTSPQTLSNVDNIQNSVVSQIQSQIQSQMQSVQSQLQNQDNAEQRQLIIPFTLQIPRSMLPVENNENMEDISLNDINYFEQILQNASQLFVPGQQTDQQIDNDEDYDEDEDADDEFDDDNDEANQNTFGNIQISIQNTAYSLMGNNQENEGENEGENEEENEGETENQANTQRHLFTARNIRIPYQRNIGINQPLSNQMLSLTRYFPLTTDNLNDYDFNLMLASLIGKVERGIDNIDTVSTKISNIDEIQQDDDICTICQENLKDLYNQDTVLLKMLCNHTFCAPCISKWLEKNVKCPICLAELDKLYENKIKTDDAQMAEISKSSSLEPSV